jgi:hypothetical protein
MWWQGHPYSLSALPRPPYIRVTIKGLGDQSRAAASLRPGTRVAIEGPYGTFTDHAPTRGSTWRPPASQTGCGTGTPSTTRCSPNGPGWN